MAEHLVRIHGTEQDRVNCSFFGKMGACRHGEKCDRRHNRPSESQTILFPNMYQSPPQYRPGPYGDIMVSAREMEDAFEEFYVDAFAEVSKLGAIEELHVCANPGPHLNGNVYIKFQTESQAAGALQKLDGRLYDGKQLKGELCPVTDFGAARCRQYSTGHCDRKMCNFLHLMEPRSKLQHQIYQWQYQNWRTHRHSERPPPQSPPSLRDDRPPSRGYGRRDDRDDRRGDRYDRRDDRRDDRRGDDRRGDDRRGDRDDHRGFNNSFDDRRRGPRHEGRRNDRYHDEEDDRDPFGRDARPADRPSDSDEQELLQKLQQVRQQMQHHEMDAGGSRKRSQPDGGFENGAEEYMRGSKQAKYD